MKTPDNTILSRRELFRTFFDKANDAVFFHGITEKGLPSLFLDANAGACELLGYSRDELLLRSPMDIVAADYRVSPEAYVEGLQNDGDGVSQAVFVRKTGEPVPVEVSSHTVELDGRHHVLSIVRDVSEKVAAQRSLFRERRTATRIMETSPVGILLADRNGRVLFANRHAESVVGREPGGLAGSRLSGPDWKLTDLEGSPLPSVASPFFNPLKTGQSIHGGQYGLFRPDGSRVYISVNAAPLFDADARPDGIVASLEDISERIRSEHAAREQMQLLALGATVGTALATELETPPMLHRCCEALVEHIHAAFARIWILDEDQSCLRLEASAGLYTHLDGKHARIGLDGPLKIAGIARTGTAVHTNAVVGDPAIEDQGWARTEGMVAFAGMPLRIEDRVVGVMALFARRTLSESVLMMLSSVASQIAVGVEYRRMVEELRLSEARFRDVVQSSPMGIHTYRLAAGDKLIFTGANRSADRILDIDHEDLVGKTIETAFPGLAPTDIPSIYRRVARGGEPWSSAQVDYADDRIGGVYEVHAFQTGPDRVASFFLDISDRQRAEEEKSRLEAQLRQSQKMEAVGQLAGGVAHDFNNLLTTITGYAELLAMRLTDPDDRSQLEMIRTASDKAATLTQSLLAFSRKQVLEPRPVDVNELIANLQKLLLRLIGEDIELRSHFGEASLTALVDPNQMEQILLNLAANARDAMPDGGTLTIETQRAISKDPAVAGDVLIAVTDSGTGMTPQIRERIFEPFFTTKDVGRGTGLGLSTVYGIVRQHGGQIEVDSEAGRGSTFRIRLPATDAPETAEASPEKSAPPGGTETILLAEDDDAVRYLLRNVLEQKGYTVHDAVDGEKALALFEIHRDDIDLMLLDVIMPKKNGKDVLEEARRRRPGIRAAFISGYSGDLLARRGVNDRDEVPLLRKPVTPVAFLHRVRDILDSKPPSAGAV